LADPPRHAADLRPANTGGAVAGSLATPAPFRRLPVIPERYSVREKDGVRFVECDEAPRLRALIDPAMSVSRSVAASLGDRVILLDGAGDFGPLIDNERKLYNLDHHAGCERLFTLSTCEQALLLVNSGLDLSEGDWTLYANEPDLDTVLALWCLLNHRRVRELRSEARDVLLPLLRMEGAIDANGPELARLCGLSTAQLERTSRRIDDLLERERSLKQTGSWAGKNVHAYACEMLRVVDALVYVREDFGDYTHIEEVYGHVEVAPRKVAVACRDRSGIYTVEQHLKTRWGDQLSLIALENQPGHYTLRRVSTLAGPELGPAYDLLNRVDRAVDGRPPSKRWGGSQDIGGSPRAHGTELQASEILALLAEAYQTSPWWTRARRLIGAFLVGVSFLFFPSLASVFPSLGSTFTSLGSVLALLQEMAVAYQVALASLISLAVGLLILRVVSERRPWVFGWRAAANGGGWWLSPLALLGALPVAVWVSARPIADLRELLVAAGVCAFGVAAVEVWFRGVVHGILVLESPVQRPGGPWFLSRGTLVSAASYAVVATVLASRVLDSAWLARLELEPREVAGGIAALMFGVGLALGVIRERSLSLLPGIGIQLLGVLAAAGLWFAGG
jgi:hypothetical protein